MATPAAIRRNRKSVLRKVKATLKTMDSSTEKAERMITRVLKVKKRFPDVDDAIYIQEMLKTIDKQLNNVVKAANDFAEIVQAF